MKSLSLFILGTLFSVPFSYSQEKYLPLVGVRNQSVIDSIETQILKNNCKSIVYEQFHDNIYCGMILIISCCNSTKYWILNNDSIASTGDLKSDSLFLYSDYKKTGAIDTEQYSSDTFIPPILCGINTENVIYKDNRVVFYFEYGENIVSHKELPERKKYREEWLKIIRNSLELIIDCSTR